MSSMVNVLVLDKNGRPASYIEVAASVGGFPSGMTDDFRTDENGRATVIWYSSATYLEHLYVAGERHEGPYRPEDGQVVIYL